MRAVRVAIPRLDPFGACAACTTECEEVKFFLLEGTRHGRRERLYLNTRRQVEAKALSRYEVERGLEAPCLWSVQMAGGNGYERARLLEAFKAGTILVDWEGVKREAANSDGRYAGLRMPRPNGYTWLWEFKHVSFRGALSREAALAPTGAAGAIFFTRDAPAEQYVDP